MCVWGVVIFVLSVMRVVGGVPLWVVCVFRYCCCSPSETYGWKRGDSNFKILTELPVPPQAAGVDVFSRVDVCLCLLCTLLLF